MFVDSPIVTCLEQLVTNDQLGLTDVEAKGRMADHGKNELPKDPPTPLWKMFLEQLSDLLVMMLIVASIVAGALGEIAASVVIILIVIANAILGVVQESRAGAALDALESLSAPSCEVIRDGRQVQIDSVELVPGDIVILENGRKVPADLRLIESQNLYSNEMPLTGEPEGVAKDALYIGTSPDNQRNSIINTEKKDQIAIQVETPLGNNQKPKITLDNKEEKKEKKESKDEHEESLTDKNMVYMGCDINEGRGKGLVVKTGVHTKMGEIALLLKTADSEQSPLQAKLHDLGVKLGFASIAVSIIVFIIGMSTGGRGADPGSDQPLWLQMLLVAVSLTVAAVPEGLPACVTITLAIGMREMVKKNALIRNLHSVETLGSASVICTDKTGTLTKGIMTAVRLWYRDQTYKITGTGYDPRGHIFPIEIDEKNEGEIQHAVQQLSSQGNTHTLPLVVGALSSNAVVQFNETTKQWECPGNASERPIVVAAAKVGLKPEVLLKQFPRIKENPFNSHRKMSSSLHDISGDSNGIFLHKVPYIAAVKGAPNIVLENSISMVDRSGVRDLSQADRDRIMQTVDEFSEQAFRVLAIAYQPLDSRPMDENPEHLEKNLVFIGLVASIDPERAEVTPSIHKARSAGIRVVMITGDYVKTAKAIAENITILPKNPAPEKAVDCTVLRGLGTQEDNINKRLKIATEKGDKSQIESIKNEKKAIQVQIDKLTSVADVFARARPVDKITIVRSLQRQGHVASMTGDGVNDAPALKQANIGVAMGVTGTDVAKAAADMVLVDDNFCSIVEAIEQGRTIYNNIQKFVFYLLSTNIAEVFFILVAVIIGYPSPLSPIQILWLNLTTDGAPAVALAVELVEPGVMREGPRPKNESILEKVMVTGIVIQSIVLTFCCLMIYIVGLYWYTDSWDGKAVRIIDPSTGVLETDKQYNARLEDLTNHARTMAILYIVFAELLRAYGARSLRHSVFELGLFSNRFMQPAVSIAVLATIFVALVPKVQDVFDMRNLQGRDWAFVLVFSLAPITVDEFTKLIYRATGYGLRPQVPLLVAEEEDHPGRQEKSDPKAVPPASPKNKKQTATSQV